MRDSKFSDGLKVDCQGDAKRQTTICPQSSSHWSVCVVGRGTSLHDGTEGMVHARNRTPSFVLTVIGEAQGIVHEPVDLEILREAAFLQSFDGSFDPSDRVLLVVSVRDRNERGTKIRDDVIADYFDRDLSDHDHSNQMLAVIWIDLLFSKSPGLLGSPVNLICHVLQGSVCDVVNVAVLTEVIFWRNEDGPMVCSMSELLSILSNREFPSVVKGDEHSSFVFFDHLESAVAEDGESVTNHQ